MSFVEVQARIQEIRNQLGLPLTGVADAASGDQFAATLKSTLDSTGAVRPTSGVTGDQVVADARKYLGTPYVFGGTNPESGLDCSALVQRAYADLGVKLPRVAKDQAKEGVAVPSLAQARPGDLIAFNSPVTHIGIYIGDNKMIVAPHTGDVVKIQTVYQTPSAIRRILPDVATVPPVPSTGAVRPTTASYAAGAAVRPATLGGASGVPYAGLFQKAGAQYGVAPALLAAVAQVESGYNAGAVNGSGAQGLMQIMPSTARGLGVDALDPAQAIDGAARMLSSGMKQFGSVDLALAAYNAGGGAVRKYGGIPPFAQTQAYVPKVKAAMQQLAGRGFA